VARRAVRYHRQHRPRGGTALDAGCGEGQDLAFLAERGYVATGIEFAETGAAKAERLLRARGLEGEVIRTDLRAYQPSRRFDLVLAVNTTPFLGADGDACLRRLVSAVMPGGVFGISMFARHSGDGRGDRGQERRDGGTGATTGRRRGDEERAAPGEIAHGFWLLSLEELMTYFTGWQMLEASRLWQWNPHTNRPQPFATLIARNTPAPPPPLPLP
jgi:cyclopropane fatty-acyl-phospholipid synthase-like methyltransferase